MQREKKPKDRKLLEFGGLTQNDHLKNGPILKHIATNDSHTCSRNHAKPHPRNSNTSAAERSAFQIISAKK
jgi:hypothetical protein